MLCLALLDLERQFRRRWVWQCSANPAQRAAEKIRSSYTHAA